MAVVQYRRKMPRMDCHKSTKSNDKKCVSVNLQPMCICVTCYCQFNAVLSFQGSLEIFILFLHRREICHYKAKITTKTTSVQIGCYVVSHLHTWACYGVHHLCSPVQNGIPNSNLSKIADQRWIQSLRMSNCLSIPFQLITVSGWLSLMVNFGPSAYE